MASQQESSRPLKKRATCRREAVETLIMLQNSCDSIGDDASLVKKMPLIAASFNIDFIYRTKRMPYLQICQRRRTSRPHLARSRRKEPLATASALDQEIKTSYST